MHIMLKFSKFFKLNNDQSTDQQIKKNIKQHRIMSANAKNITSNQDGSFNLGNPKTNHTIIQSNKNLPEGKKRPKVKIDKVRMSSD